MEHEPDPVPKSEVLSMLCLSDRIRLDDPDWQHGLQVAYDAQSLIELLLAAWALARRIAVL